MNLTENCKFAFIIAVLCALPGEPALAGSSDWIEMEGARLRVVTETPGPGAKTLRGILQVDLEPGWKTYWREPGASGIPPQVNVAEGASEATVHFPVPHWVDQSYGSWAGYTEPLSLPLTFHLEDGATAVAVDVFLGICDEVCVPVTGRFEVPLGQSSASALHSIQVDAAFANLPGPNTEALSIGEPFWTEEGMLEIRIRHHESGGETELFLAGGPHREFRKPVAVSEGLAETVFRAMPLFDPSDGGTFELIAAARHGNDSAEITIQLGAP